MGQTQEQSIAFKPYVSCGSCTACCEHLTVAGWDSVNINRLAGTACEHCKTGHKRPCAIYAQRPSICSSYECEFKTQSLAPRFRPDRSGFIIDRSADLGGTVTLNVTATDPNLDCEQFLAQHGSNVRAALAAIEGSNTMIISLTTSKDRQHLQVPGGDAAQYQQVVDQQRQVLAELFSVEASNELDFVLLLLTAPSAQGQSVLNMIKDPRRLTTQQRQVFLDYLELAKRKPKKREAHSGKPYCAKR